MNCIARNLAAFALVFSTSSALAQESLFILGPERVLDAAKEGAVSVRSITLNTEILEQGSSIEFLLELPEEKLAASLQPLSPKSTNLAKGQSAWYGRFNDKVGGDIFLFEEKGIVRATINRGEFIHEIRTLAEGRRILETKAAKDAFPPDHPPETNGQELRPPEQRGDTPLPIPDCADPADEIDVLVAYTPAARDSAGGTVQIEAEIHFAMARTNLANSDSAVFHRLNLVHTSVVDFTEAAAGDSIYTLLSNLQSTNDMVMDAIHGLRDTHKADLVSLVAERATGGCGLGYFLEDPTAGSAPYGFNVVRRDCAGGNLSFAHEFGHNLGADHDRANANTGTHTWNFNYGHIQPVPAMGAPWRTVMSYLNPCGSQAGASCVRLPVFSNPGIVVQGDAAGAALSDAEPEHNVEAFSRTDNIVSQFRCRTSQAAAKAWMKDTWADTSLEPDPATTAQAMWESPYIWTRNTADATLEHQHEHQNPELGSTNYMYVKIHNDGAAAASGALELYWANASTNLNSPSNWNLIQSQSVASLAPGTNTMQFPWSNLPGSGHYCLMARWNDNATPLNFSDLNTYVRNSRRVVWRNMSIVDLLPDEAPDQQFVVRGTANGDPVYLVLNSTPAGAANVPWEKFAKLRVKLLNPEKFDGEWAGKGLEPIDKYTLEAYFTGKPTVIGPILLKDGQELTVGLETLFDPGLVKEYMTGLNNDAMSLVRILQTGKDGAAVAFDDPESLFTKEGLVTGGNTYVLTVKAASKEARNRR